jgi:hypothetical protein
VNGVVALPMRLLGAATPSEACGNATSPACVLAGVGTDPTYSATRIQCAVPPGVGLGFQMLIRDTWTSLVPNGAKAGYSPPTITAVAPAIVPAAGGELTITGSGFGPGPCTDVNRTSGVQVCHRVCSLFSVWTMLVYVVAEGGRVRVWMGSKGSTVNMGCFNMRPWHTTGKCLGGC